MHYGETETQGSTLPGSHLGDKSLSSSQHSEVPGPDPLLCRAGGTRWRACVNCFCRDHLQSLLSSPAVTQAGIPSLCSHLVFHQPRVNSSLPTGTMMGSPEHLDCSSKIVGWRMITLPCHDVKKKKKKKQFCKETDCESLSHLAHPLCLVKGGQGRGEESGRRRVLDKS